MERTIPPKGRKSAAKRDEIAISAPEAGAALPIDGQSEEEHAFDVPAEASDADDRKLFEFFNMVRDKIRVELPQLPGDFPIRPSAKDGYWGFCCAFHRDLEPVDSHRPSIRRYRKMKVSHVAIKLRRADGSLLDLASLLACLLHEFAHCIEPG